MKPLFFITISSIIFIYQFSIAQVGGNDKDSIRKEKRTGIVIREKRIDSLKRLIARTPDDTAKVLLLAQLSEEEGNDIANATTELAEKARSLAEKLHYKRGIAVACRAIGMIYQNRKDYATAITYFQQAINTAEGDNYISNKGLYATLLNLYFYLGDYPNAMETVTRELGGYEKRKDKSGIAHCNNLLGYIYFKQENFSEAEKYYDLYIRNARELHDSNMLAHALGEVSDVYTAEKKYGQSVNSLFNVLQICERGMAPGVNLANYGTNGWLSQYKAKAMYRLGRNYKLMGNLDEALKYSLSNLELINPKGTTDYDSASYLISIGDIYKELKEYSKAIHYLSIGFNVSQKIHHRENTRDAAGYLAQTYAMEKKYDSAFFFYQLFTGLKDSIVNNETKMKIAGIQGQYDVAKKDKEIERQHQFRNILIGSFIFLLLTLVFLYNRYQLRQKNIYQKELNRQQNELFNAIAAAQDQERKRIAQDIHDSLGSILSAAKLKLSALKESQPLLSNDQAEKYRVTSQLLDEASAELRSISHNIMPATLSKLGLVAALKNLSNTISSHSGLQVSFSAHGFMERIPEQTEMSIYRIVLELINNIVKHAQANKVTVQLIKYPDYINLSVEDNGRGFDYEDALQQKKGIGLGNILSRVEYLRAKMNVDSVPGRGTTVIIDVPLGNAAT
jgi:signal transduction histidine kinase